MYKIVWVDNDGREHNNIYNDDSYKFCRLAFCELSAKYESVVVYRIDTLLGTFPVLANTKIRYYEVIAHIGNTHFLVTCVSSLNDAEMEKDRVIEYYNVPVMIQDRVF